MNAEGQVAGQTAICPKMADIKLIDIFLESIFTQIISGVNWLIIFTPRAN